MLIDWFTVGAQTLNFLILVWLMSRFLYKPILRAIDAREARIAAALSDAASKAAEAEKDRDEFQRKNAEFDEQRAGLLAKATGEAADERQRLIEEARTAADTLAAKQQDALDAEVRNLGEAIGIRTQREVFAIARKALADLATVDLEERIGEVFILRLREIGGTEKSDLWKALDGSAGPAVVQSAFDLPAEQRDAIQKALNETFSAEVHIGFETVPDLVGGIVLRGGGQRVSWSIASYLALLEKGVVEVLKVKSPVGAEPTDPPETNQK